MFMQILAIKWFALRACDSGVEAFEKKQTSDILRQKPTRWGRIAVRMWRLSTPYPNRVPGWFQMR